MSAGHLPPHTAENMDRLAARLTTLLGSIDNAALRFSLMPCPRQDDATSVLTYGQVVCEEMQKILAARAAYDAVRLGV